VLFLLDDSPLEELSHELFDRFLLFRVNLARVGNTLVLEVGIDKLFRAFFGKTLDVISVEFALVFVCNMDDRWEELYECQSRVLASSYDNTTYRVFVHPLLLLFG